MCDTGRYANGKYASVIAVGEQSREEDLGYTAEVMEKSLEALGYRTVSIVKGLGMFAPGDALHSKNKHEIVKARQAGEKLLKTLKLRNEAKVESK